ncbi:hypothetical protein HOY80DRAFT_1140969 [Tuber brumale]|nr:hypothetical protein HOY80DRAFT_1140969 [Tuber brumale]
MSMSTNPRFIKHKKVNEINSATTKSAHGGFSFFANNNNTGYDPIKEATIPFGTSRVTLLEKVKESKKDKYDVPYDEDFDAWFAKWEAQEAQRVIDGAPNKYGEYDQEIGEDLEAYLGGVQKEISSGLCKRNSKGVLVLTDREEAGLVERKRGCLPPPLPKPGMTDEVLKDIKYMVQAEQQRFGTPMQGIAMTATVYQDLCNKIETEEKIRIEMKKTTAGAMSAKNTPSRVPWTGGDAAPRSPYGNIPAFSFGQSTSKPHGWPETIPPPATNRGWDNCHSSLPVQSPIANSNDQEPTTLSESETPGPIEYFQGIEAYIQTDTAYVTGPMTNSHDNSNIISPRNKRGSDDDLIELPLGNQRRRISPYFYVQTGSDDHQGNGGRAGHRGRGRGRKNRGHGHWRSH